MLLALRWVVAGAPAVHLCRGARFKGSGIGRLKAFRKGARWKFLKIGALEYSSRGALCLLGYGLSRVRVRGFFGKWWGATLVSPRTTEL